MPNSRRRVTASSNLGYRRGGNLGRVLVVLLAWQRLRHRPYVEDVRMLGGKRFFALFERLRGLDDASARGDNAQVTGAEVLFRAIADRPHTLLHGQVLLADTGNPGERFAALYLAIHQVII